jgi:membrane protein YqaA with SNARE-associated domain
VDPGAQLRQRLLAGAVMVAVLVLSLLLALNPEWVLRFGNWGYAGAFVISLVASASLILPLPGLALVIALGVALNPLLLGIVTGVASALGELMGYALGSSGRFLLSGDQQRHYDRLESWTKQYGALAIFTVAVLPLPIFDVAGIVAGAIRMPIWSFLIATALGKSIKYTVLILIAAGWFSEVVHWFH